jgi:hypothetical protein
MTTTSRCSSHVKQNCKVCGAVSSSPSQWWQLEDFSLSRPCTGTGHNFRGRIKLASVWTRESRIAAPPTPPKMAVIPCWSSGLLWVSQVAAIFAALLHVDVDQHLGLQSLGLPLTRTQPRRPRCDRIISTPLLIDPSLLKRKQGHETRLYQSPYNGNIIPQWHFFTQFRLKTAVTFSVTHVLSSLCVYGLNVPCHYDFQGAILKSPTRSGDPCTCI